MTVHRMLCVNLQVKGLLGGCEVVGFAGTDYEGPTPPWMHLRRCRIRTKNGAGWYCVRVDECANHKIAYTQSYQPYVARHTCCHYVFDSCPANVLKN